MLTLHSPGPLELKFSSILTVAIAFDRLSALQWPINYKLKRRSHYAAGALAIGLLWGTFDVTFDLTTAAFTANPNCAAAGCFLSTKFRYYQGVSNMFINAFTMAITALVYFKIKSIKIHPGRLVLSTGSSSEIESAKFTHANRIVLSVLLCSGVFVFIPSIFSGLGEMIGLAAFAALGPFVGVGLLASGVGNAFIFGFKHTAIRQAIRSTWNKIPEQQTRTSREVRNQGRI
uniref:G-protein coupled receptors family 1 profile domain-containing protein n=1 Tax=Plectus sambesii TaxID=2011161 RepID=A0A914V3D1_9BILA